MAYQTVADIEKIVLAFEDHTLPLAAWTHNAHLTVAVYYLFTLGLDKAYARMKAQIIAYNEATGVPNSNTRGYHESITIFWLEYLNHFFTEKIGQKSATTLLDVCNSLDSLSKNTLLTYYTESIIFSIEARKTWIAPDKKPLK